MVARPRGVSARSQPRRGSVKFRSWNFSLSWLDSHGRPSFLFATLGTASLLCDPRKQLVARAFLQYSKPERTLYARRKVLLCVCSTAPAACFLRTSRQTSPPSTLSTRSGSCPRQPLCRQAARTRLKKDCLLEPSGN